MTGKPPTERAGTAIREAEGVLTKRPTHRDAESRVRSIARRYDVPLRLVVEAKTANTERVHVQTMATDSHDLPTGGPAEESEEVKLLDDGATSAEAAMQKVLAEVRGVVQDDGVIGAVLKAMREGQIKKANRVGILRKLITLGEKHGYRLTLREHTVDGRKQLDMEYYGVYREQAIKVGNVRPGGTRPVGEAWVEPKSIGDGETPVEALALDFLVDPKIELAGVSGLGSRMFTLAADHFRTQYRAVAGEWYTLSGYASKATGRPAMSKNLVDYLAARKAGAGPEAAVRATWTYGRVRKMYGVDLQVQVEELPGLDFDNPPVDARIVRFLL